MREKMVQEIGLSHFNEFVSINVSEIEIYSTLVFTVFADLLY